MRQDTISKKLVINDFLLEINDCIDSQIAKSKIDSSLYSGTLGTIIFKFELSRYVSSEELSVNARSLLEHIVSGADFDMGDFSICNGVGGLSWTLHKLCGAGYIDFDKSQLAQLNLLLKKRSLMELERNNIDFLHGALGMFYTIIRTEGELNENTFYIQNFIKKLAQVLESNSTVYGYPNVDPFSRHDKNFCDLGMAHGLPGMVTILISCYKIFPSKELEAIIIKSSKIITSRLELKNFNLGKSILPISIKENVSEHRSSMLGWCYGDVGSALALFKIGEFLKNMELVNLSKLMVDSALKSFRFDLKNEGLCHGNYGIAFLLSNYSTLLSYNLSNDAVIKFLRKNNINILKLKSPCFLEGLSGIGLFLLNEDQKPLVNWKELLLFD